MSSTGGKTFRLRKEAFISIEAGQVHYSQSGDRIRPEKRLSDWGSPFEATMTPATAKKATTSRATGKPSYGRRKRDNHVDADDGTSADVSQKSSAEQDGSSSTKSLSSNSADHSNPNGNADEESTSSHPAIPEDDDNSSDGNDNNDSDSDNVDDDEDEPLSDDEEEEITQADFAGGARPSGRNLPERSGHTASTKKPDANLTSSRRPDHEQREQRYLSSPSPPPPSQGDIPQDEEDDDNDGNGHDSADEEHDDGNDGNSHEDEDSKESSGQEFDSEDHLSVEGSFALKDEYEDYPPCRFRSMDRNSDRNFSEESTISSKPSSRNVRSNQFNPDDFDSDDDSDFESQDWNSDDSGSESDINFNSSHRALPRSKKGWNAKSPNSQESPQQSNEVLESSRISENDSFHDYKEYEQVCDGDGNTDPKRPSVASGEGISIATFSPSARPQRKLSSSGMDIATDTFSDDPNDRQEEEKDRGSRTSRSRNSSSTNISEAPLKVDDFESEDDSSDSQHEEEDGPQGSRDNRSRGGHSSRNSAKNSNQTPHSIEDFESDSDESSVPIKEDSYATRDEDGASNSDEESQVGLQSPALYKPRNVARHVRMGYYSDSEDEEQQEAHDQGLESENDDMSDDAREDTTGGSDEEEDESDAEDDVHQSPPQSKSRARPRSDKDESPISSGDEHDDNTEDSSLPLSQPLQKDEEVMPPPRSERSTDDDNEDDDIEDDGGDDEDGEEDDEDDEGTDGKGSDGDAAGSDGNLEDDDDLSSAYNDEYDSNVYQSGVYHKSDLFLESTLSLDDEDDDESSSESAISNVAEESPSKSELMAANSSRRSSSSKKEKSSATMESGASSKQSNVQSSADESDRSFFSDSLKTPSKKSGSEMDLISEHDESKNSSKKFQSEESLDLFDLNDDSKPSSRNYESEDSIDNVGANDDAGKPGSNKKRGTSLGKVEETDDEDSDVGSKLELGELPTPPTSEQLRNMREQSARDSDDDTSASSGYGTNQPKGEEDDEGDPAKSEDKKEDLLKRLYWCLTIVCCLFLAFDVALVLVYVVRNYGIDRSEPEVDFLDPTRVVATVPQAICLEHVPGKPRNEGCGAGNVRQRMLEGDEVDSNIPVGGSVGDVIAEAIWNTTMAMHYKYGLPTDFSLIHAGMAQTDIAAGEFTVQDAMDLLGTQDKTDPLVVVEVTGRQVELVLEKAMEFALGFEKADLTSSYPYGAGIRFDVNVAVGTMDRVLDISVWQSSNRFEGNGKSRRRALRGASLQTRGLENGDGEWLPLDRERNYAVITTQKLVQGGEGYLELATSIQDAKWLETDALESFVRYADWRGVLEPPASGSTRRFVSRADTG